jgi:RimJ/RimL family protein N-acetyltransferase
VTESRFAIREVSGEGFRRLAAGEPPEPGLTLPDPPLAPVEVLGMLSRLAETLRAALDPNAWMVLDRAKVVALCSVTSLAEPGVPMIGYGTAPGEEGRGAATAAVAGVLEWARDNPRIRAVGAETGEKNLASQRVLERNGFRVAGARVDDEDGPLLCWRWDKD